MTINSATGTLPTVSGSLVNSTTRIFELSVSNELMSSSEYTYSGSSYPSSNDLKFYLFTNGSSSGSGSASDGKLIVNIYSAYFS